MTNQNQKKQDEGKGGVSPVVAAVTGVVVGAGIAAAGVALSDKKNREKVNKVATHLKNDVVGYVENVQKQAEAKKKELEKRISTDKEKVRKVVDSVKSSVDKTTKEVNKAAKSL